MYEYPVPVCFVLSSPSQCRCFAIALAAFRLSSSVKERLAVSPPLQNDRAARSAPPLLAFAAHANLLLGEDTGSRQIRYEVKLVFLSHHGHR